MMNPFIILAGLLISMFVIGVIVSNVTQNNHIIAPFTDEQVEALNLYQKTGIFHPYTCGSGHRTDDKHLDGEGLLIATKDGWKCPYCDYTQNWAHKFSANIKNLHNRFGSHDF